jgi:predicted alpha/beta hydrolase family esterase
MKMHHVIYVPGLGDAKPQGQQLVTELWRPLGVRGHYVPMHWAVDEPWQTKLERLLQAIDELSKSGTVSLVGTSAGASAVLQAYERRRTTVAGVVCICGKINNVEAVNPDYYTENPSFKDALAWLQKALPKLSAADCAHILSIHPLWDGVVPVQDTVIPGAQERTILAAGHAFSIFVTLVFGAPSFMRFLKRQAITR